MHLSKRWFCFIYFYLYTLMVGYFTMEFFRPHSAVNFYYQFLLAFKPYFLIPYFLHLLAIIVGLLSLAPFYSFLTGIPSFSQQFARWLFFARLGLDLFGRSYDIKSLQALAYHNSLLPVIFAAAYLLISLGSYWAHFMYAFRRRSAL